MIKIQSIDTSLFQRGLTGLADYIGDGPKVLAKEVGELEKTLVKITPPEEPAKTRERIAGKVRGAFSEFDATPAFDISGETSSSGVKWYAANRSFLFGMKPEQDMTSASAADLKPIFLATKRIGRDSSNTKARLVYPFKHPRARQRVAIMQRIVTSKKSVTGLVKYFSGHVGRLKAGWLVAVEAGAIKLTGGNQPPQWVRKHMRGARGWFVNGLGDEKSPSFTIANFATGTGNPRNNLNFLVQQALNIRGQAMLRNASLFFKGKKNLSDYAK